MIRPRKIKVLPEPDSFRAWPLINACTNEKAKESVGDAVPGTYSFLIVGNHEKLIGIITVYPMHPFKKCGLVVEHMCWLPDSTTREKIEATAAVFEQVPRLMGYSCKKDEKFFKMFQKNKLIKKAGKTGLVLSDEHATIWENYKK